MDSNLYKDMHQENQYRNTNDSLSYKDVHEKNPEEYGQSFLQRCT